MNIKTKVVLGAVAALGILTVFGYINASIEVRNNERNLQLYRQSHPVQAQTPRTPEQQEALVNKIRGQETDKKIAELTNPRNVAAMGAVQIKHMMKDPDSFKLKSAILMPDGSACYIYSATNTFGGRMEEYGVLTPKGRIQLNDPTPWKKFCVNKSGDELVASAQ